MTTNMTSSFEPNQHVVDQLELAVEKRRAHLDKNPDTPIGKVYETLTLMAKIVYLKNMQDPAYEAAP